MKHLFISLILIQCIWRFSNSGENPNSDTLEIKTLHIHEFHENNLAIKRQEKWNTLNTKAIDKYMGTTIADVTDNLPGMHIQSLGPAPARTRLSWIIRSSSNTFRR